MTILNELAPGTRVGPYEIVASIGEGGMGVVYRAHDARLGRDVAIKVLPRTMSADPDRLRRFELEARAAAALNHPGILAVFDVGTEAGAPYIVSELLEGETLRARLSHAGSASAGKSGTAIPARKAVDWAIQIARGLSAAHGKGIAHRDLKPENLFLTTEGHVKILDFGLAKLTERAHAQSPADTMLPTTPPGTEVGIALGTAGYMAPEQVRGLAIDHRADVFAFGAVLYEMLSGQRAFRGDTPADTMSAILDKDPPELQSATLQIPPALARIVYRCLEKSPAARFQSTQDLAFALEGLSGQSDTVVTRPEAIDVEKGPPRVARREVLAWTVAGLLLLTLGAGGAVMYRRPPIAAPLVRFSIRPPAGVTLVTGPVAMSPDGNRIVYVGRRGSAGPQTLWLQSFDAFEGRVLSGTENGGDPFWSPDGKRIGFFADRRLKTLEIEGGAVESLSDVPDGTTGGSWGKDGVILVGAAYGGLTRVSASGGPSVAATVLDGQRQEDSHRRPTFLPDGRHFTYAVQPGNHVFLGSLDSAERTELLNADSQVVYASGHLLFGRQTSLFAQPFNVDTYTLSGNPVAIAEQVLVNVVGPSAAFGVSESGTLVYETGVLRGNARIPMQLTWFDRSGKSLGTASEVADYRSIELSPDGRRLAEHHHDNETGGDIWLRDLEREATTRLTFGGHNTEAIWSPDGSRIIYSSNRPVSGKPPQDLVYGGPFNLFMKRADGGSEANMILDSEASGTPIGWKQPTSWSPDGQFILFDMINARTLHDIWLMPLTGGRKPVPWLQTEFREVSAQISPDGKWVAYQSDETGRAEIYVRPLSGSGKWSVSTTGGGFARWRADGQELYYISPNNKLMAVPIRVAGEGLDAGAPRPLFDIRVAFPNGGLTNRSNTPFPYSPTKDGQRFLVSVDVSPPAETPPISVVLNWTAALKR